PSLSPCILLLSFQLNTFTHKQLFTINTYILSFFLSFIVYISIHLQLNKPPSPTIFPFPVIPKITPYFLHFLSKSLLERKILPMQRPFITLSTQPIAYFPFSFN
ncbi:hypothetical protein V8G54_012954, partial [Vigna mungo]